MNTSKSLSLVIVDILLVTLRWTHVSGGSIDEIIAGASETYGQFNLADMDSGTRMQELDMILTLEQYTALHPTTSVKSADGDSSVSRQKRKAVKGNAYRWKNNVIPYKIVSGIFSENDMKEINAAIQEWQNYTCISFRGATRDDTNYVSIDNGNGCYSYVGMTGGPQTLGLATGCRFKGVVVHEMGHAVGFHHEQNRPDRDDHVTINEGNIPQNLLYNFKKYPYEAVETLGVPYDYRSVMHYGGRAFSFNGQLTIQTKDPQYQNVIGNREGLSFFDIKLANLMYKCGDRCGNIRCPEPGFLGKDCKCWCPGRPVQVCDGTASVQTTPKPITPNTTVVSPCKDMNKYCKPWAEAGYCTTNTYVKTYCRESCKTCEQGPNSAQTTCMDKNEKCSEWKGRGLCSGFYFSFMKNNCAKTCNICGGLQDMKDGHRNAAIGLVASLSALVVSMIVSVL
ncbi:hypothetical protein Btru_008283 [Bulinus truncatus]|nr:hypothetical protein Btru_008283 [Bulinus truncatus]